MTLTEFGLRKAIEIILKSYMQNTFTHVLLANANNGSKVRPSDLSGRAHCAGPAGSKFWKVRTLSFLPRYPVSTYRTCEGFLPKSVL